MPVKKARALRDRLLLVGFVVMLLAYVYRPLFYVVVRLPSPVSFHIFFITNVLIVENSSAETKGISASIAASESIDEAHSFCGGTCLNFAPCDANC